MKGKELTKYAWLSIAAALLTMGLKASAYFITRSVGLLSDALESTVNLAGAVMALSMLTIASRPADDEHTYGHSKAEYFSSGLEGALILAAAASIAYSAVQRLLNPQPLYSLGVGLVISLAAGLVNLGVALLLIQQGKANHSITLRANGYHLLTDVWTSLGVLVGVGAVVLTGWEILDPVIALILAVNISWTGAKILRDTIRGLMDTAIPEEELEIVTNILDRSTGDGIEYHALRTRTAGSRRFVFFHLLVPGSWSVFKGHQLAEQIEKEIYHALPRVTTSVHVEPLNDPSSWIDTALDREYQDPRDSDLEEGSTGSNP